MRSSIILGLTLLLSSTLFTSVSGHCEKCTHMREMSTALETGTEVSECTPDYCDLKYMMCTYSPEKQGVAICADIYGWAKGNSTSGLGPKASPSTTTTTETDASKSSGTSVEPDSSKTKDASSETPATPVTAGSAIVAPIVPSTETTAAANSFDDYYYPTQSSRDSLYGDIYQNDNEFINELATTTSDDINAGQVDSFWDKRGGTKSMGRSPLLSFDTRSSLANRALKQPSSLSAANRRRLSNRQNSYYYTPSVSVSNYGASANSASLLDDYNDYEYGINSYENDEMYSNGNLYEDQATANSGNGPADIDPATGLPYNKIDQDQRKREGMSNTRYFINNQGQIVNRRSYLQQQRSANAAARRNILRRYR